jgi:nucleotide-binding universal stress UspA family protein
MSTMQAATPVTEPRVALFRRILAGFDRSKESARAVAVAIDLAASIGATVVVLSVLQAPAHVESSDEAARLHEASVREVADALAKSHAHASRLGVVLEDVVIEASDRAAGFAEHARSRGFDLVVVGRHGQDQASHRGLGRLMGELLAHLACPVLVV